MEITLEPLKIFKEIWNNSCSPKAFLKKDQEDLEIGEILTYHVFATLIGFGFATIFYYAIVPQVYKLFPNAYIAGLLPDSFVENLSYMLVSFLLAIVFSFFWSLIFMGWVKLFKGEITFIESYRTIVYGRTTFYLFRWIPILHIVAMIYSSYLIYLSLRSTYKLKKIRAFTAIISGIALIILGAYLIVISYQIS